MPSFIGFIPTPIEQIDGFFELAKLSESDVVYDLGSGDGRLLFAALEKGAGKVVGVELNPELIRQATEIAKNKGVEDRIAFLEADVMEVNLSDASVVFCYLSTQASSDLKLKLESELKAGTRIVMELFPIPGWRSVRTIDKDRKPFYLYSMPTETSEEVAGRDPLLDYLNY
jgi:SAM-dependent methyltransferase